MSEGKIVVGRVGVGLTFTHVAPDGTPLRKLVKQPFQNAQAWKQAMEDWLSNYDEDMVLIKPCGSQITVAAFESERGL